MGSTVTDKSGPRTPLQSELGALQLRCSEAIPVILEWNGPVGQLLFRLEV